MNKCMYCGKDVKNKFCNVSCRNRYWNPKLKIWNKGLTKDTDDRVKRNIENSRKTIQKQYDEGRIVWNKGLTKETDERIKEYSKKQSNNRKGIYHTLKYFQELYGEDKGYEEYNRIGKLKKLTLKNFMRKYGKIEGKKKFNDFIKNRKTSFYSKISQELFWKLYDRLNDKKNVYFAELNKEYGKSLNNGKYYFFDFVDNEKKKIIEFNGDYWHANPDIYDESWFNGIKKKTASDIWEDDDIKLNEMKKLGYNILIIWQNDYIKNQNKVINECIKFIEG